MSWGLFLLRIVAFVLVLSAYLLLWAGLGFLIAVFHTNPPPPIPGRENVVEFSRYCLFGIVSLLIGAICGAGIAKFGSGKEKA